jgi:transcriptional regulator with XRE-family HTH domain
MRFTNLLTDAAVTAEIGRRLAAARIERQLTQAQLAEAAGISKRTVERLEDGAPTQMGNLIRCLRTLDKLEGLERLLPETPANPIELLRRHNTTRSRVRTRKEKTSASSMTPKSSPAKRGWVWGDEK